MTEPVFNYSDERFADIQLLRYRLKGFETLTLSQKKLIFYLSKATLCGRDITFDQFGKYNLLVRKIFEIIFLHYDGDKNSKDYIEMVIYLKRVWFSNGIYHHYGCDKFKPGFSRDFFIKAFCNVSDNIPQSILGDKTHDELCREIVQVIFDETFLPKRVNKTENSDLVLTSACNYYENVNQAEVESFYKAKKANGNAKISYGLNSKLVKKQNNIVEETYCVDGLYSNAIEKIVYWLDKALEYAESSNQRNVITSLIQYYKTGDLNTFNDYCIEWVGQNDSLIDFINGFIEVYGDPLGLKGSWEGIVEYKDLEATRRTKIISDNAQWFEDHSPVDSRFKKPHVKGITANVVCAAMLGGDEYPSSAIGINLPNADWIRAEYGSKSVTIGNLTEAYDKAAQGSGFREEFVIDQEMLDLINKYGGVCDDLHTDLHECLGHGSGRLLEDTDPDALKEYGDTIEEARADLFGLYYMADEKLIELGLIPSPDAYKAQYYTYIMNGLLTQLTRIQPGKNIEEAHMRNRSLIAHWCYTHGNGILQIVRRHNKSYVYISDFIKLRKCFSELLAEIQRIKSEGDYNTAKLLVEKYGVKVNGQLHKEVLERYKQLNLAPYKGFINPVLVPVYSSINEIIDIKVDYSETYTQQMLRYSKEYGYL